MQHELKGNILLNSGQFQAETTKNNMQTYCFEGVKMPKLIQNGHCGQTSHPISIQNK